MRAGAELDVESVDARVGVVLEKLLEGSPKLRCRGVVDGDQVEELGGDPGVDPLDDGEVVLDPAWIGGLRHRGGIDVIAEAAATEMNVEEVVPMIKIVLGEIEDDRDEGRDVGDRVS